MGTSDALGEAVQALIVKLHLITPEKVFEFNHAHLGYRYPPGKQVLECRHGEYLQAASGGKFSRISSACG